MPNKVYFVTRHEASPGQVNALKALHGQDVELLLDPHVFQGVDGLEKYIREHADGFVYAVAGAPHYLHAALHGAEFGVFENHPGKRLDGQFGLAAVYQVRGGQLEKVFTNSDPGSDFGEALIPVER